MLQTYKSLYISNGETDLIVEFVSRNLVTQTNFIKFRDGHNFTYVKAKRRNGKVTSGGGVIIAQIVLLCALFVTGFKYSLCNNQSN